MQATTPSRDTVHAIGALCFGGDWACSRGDLSGLRDVSLQLAAYLSEPLHCQLRDVADACYSDPSLAIDLWCRLKQRIYPQTQSQESTSDDSQTSG